MNSQKHSYFLTDNSLAEDTLLVKWYMVRQILKTIFSSKNPSYGLMIAKRGWNDKMLMV